jgi:hypothetical protein
LCTLIMYIYMVLYGCADVDQYLDIPSDLYTIRLQLSNVNSLNSIIKDQDEIISNYYIFLTF